MESIKRERKALSSVAKKRIAGALIALSCLLFIFTTFNFVYPIKAFLLGTFGFMIYAVLLVVILFCVAVLMNKKFVYSVKYLIYLLLCYFFFVCILHICVTGFSMSEGLSYGEYLISCYNSVYTPGGIIVGVFTYPVTSLLHAVAGIVVYAILFIISLYFIISYLDGIKQGKIKQPEPKTYANFNHIAEDLKEAEIQIAQEPEEENTQPKSVLKEEEEKTLTKINNEDDSDIFIKDSDNLSEEEVTLAKEKLGLISKDTEKTEETSSSKLFGTQEEDVWKSRAINTFKEEKPQKIVYGNDQSIKPKPKAVNSENVNYLRTLYEPNLNPNNPIINAETDDYKSLLHRNENMAKPFERDFSLNVNQMLTSQNKISEPQNNNQNSYYNNQNNLGNVNNNTGFSNLNNNNVSNANSGSFNNLNPAQNSYNAFGIEPTNHNNLAQFNGGQNASHQGQNNNYQNASNPLNSQNSPKFNQFGANGYNNQTNNNPNNNSFSNQNQRSFNQNNNSFNQGTNNFNNPNNAYQNKPQESENVPNFSINIEGLEEDFIKPINSNFEQKVSPLNPVNFDLSQEKFNKPQEDVTPKFMQKEANSEVPFKTSNLSEGDVSASLGKTYNLPKNLMPQTNATTQAEDEDADKNNGPDFRYNAKYVRPSIDLLETYVNEEDLTTNHERNIEVLERALDEFRIPAKVEAVRRGASVTRYELHMPAGIPVRKIHAHASDIALALAAKGDVRIETPIKGKSAVGIEVPNAKIDKVGLKDIISSQEFLNSKAPLNFALGKNVDGEVQCCNLAKMPHLLVAGSTGSGKSVCLNSLLISLIYKTSPQDLRLLLIDPKFVEFGIYNDLPHLLTPKVITEPKKALNALDWLVNEMERRYLLFQDCYVKDISEYNSQQEVVSKKWQKLPYIVAVIDEFGDIILTAGRKELEEKIVRLTQKARAAGIHLILATQRPSVEVITGTIKANLPARISFKVTSVVDSKTILDSGGAEKLIGRGDMLYSPSDSEPMRLQGAFVDTPEIKRVVEFVKQNNKAVYDEKIANIINREGGPGNNGNPATVGASSGEEFDSIMPDALKMVIENGQASISMLQRRFSVGFSRAARIIDQMEQAKFISSSDGSKPRSVFITMEDYNKIYGNR